MPLSTILIFYFGIVPTVFFVFVFLFIDKGNTTQVNIFITLRTGYPVYKHILLILDYSHCSSSKSNTLLQITLKRTTQK